MTSYYARSVPGSAELSTQRFAADPQLEELEQLPPGQLERRQVQGDALGYSVVREGFVPVQKKVFDELARRQSIIEQVVYLHLYRHSYGEERNYCRVARQQLCQLTGLSVRRYNRALAGLVAKGHVRLLQRDRRGTLYRVLLPAEIAGKQVGVDVLQGRLRGQQSEKKARTEAPAATEKRRHKVQSIGQAGTVGELVERVLAAMPARARKTAALDVLQDVTSLLEEGCSIGAIAGLTAEYARQAGRRCGDFGEYARARLGLQGGER